MDLITQSMLFLLQSLKMVFGNYGWAIIALTVLVKLVLWPASKAQMKSMKMMQTLQPKMKQLQDRYKTEPQKLQAEMMKLYQEHKFNPFGGCLPMIIQIPLFLGLFWAISNPAFLADGDPMFYNVHLNHAGIMSHGGASHDGLMNIGENQQGGFLGPTPDHLAALGEVTVTKTDGKVLKVKIPDVQKALTFKPKVLRGDVPINVSSSYSKLGLEGYEGYLKSVEATVVNNTTKELETVTFTPKANTTRFAGTLKTQLAQDKMHIDVLALVLLFAASMLLSQKQMTAQVSSQSNEQQQAMMKMMPIMFTVMIFFFPLPAGVLLYMVTNSVMQVVQTWVFQRNHAASSTPAASQTVIDLPKS